MTPLWNADGKPFLGQKSLLAYDVTKRAITAPQGSKMFKKSCFLKFLGFFSIKRYPCDPLIKSFWKSLFGPYTTYGIWRHQKGQKGPKGSKIVSPLINLAYGPMGRPLWTFIRTIMYIWEICFSIFSWTKWKEMIGKKFRFGQSWHRRPYKIL